MITQDETEIKSDPAHRLATLLQAIEDENSAFAERATEHRDTLKRLTNLVIKEKYAILTGQASLLDVMTEISHERPNGQS